MKTTAKITILLIEDNQGDSRLIKEMLNEITILNCSLIIAETIKDGCEQIKTNDISIILLDLNLPDSSGKNTFDAIMNVAPNIAIVPLSGMHNMDLTMLLIEQGAQDYILKNELNSVQLAKTILFAIERKKIELLLNEKNEQLLKATQQIEESEEKYKMLYEGINDAVFAIELNDDG